MKKRLLSACSILLCLVLLAGCECKHNWAKATCKKPKTCRLCGETKGDVSDHKPEDWEESYDFLQCTVSKERHCKYCDTTMDSETETLTSLVRDDLFAFTPAEFTERFAAIAHQNGINFTYEAIETTGFLHVVIDGGASGTFLQFFHEGATPFTLDEYETEKVWCVYLSNVTVSNADLRHCFYMACDPLLDKEAAFDVDIQLSTAYLNATLSNQILGHFVNNALLYETITTSISTSDSEKPLLLYGVYASDFR